MSRQLNKRGWYVLISIASDDGNYCVDVFERPEGDFGFQHFRSDPEDSGSWTPMNSLATSGFADEATAAATARASVGWLATEPRANRSLADWLAH